MNLLGGISFIFFIIDAELMKKKFEKQKCF